MRSVQNVILLNKGMPFSVTSFTKCVEKINNAYRFISTSCVRRLSNGNIWQYESGLIDFAHRCFCICRDSQNLSPNNRAIVTNGAYKGRLEHFFLFVYSKRVKFLVASLPPHCPQQGPFNNNFVAGLQRRNQFAQRGSMREFCQFFLDVSIDFSEQPDLICNFYLAGCDP